ncbi:hypothetical protein Scep_016067 [Stephania cephalantha]|uniref:Major facilitator superfamily (MFS) profile domain-containing protein n=1 Tax=Stephania cephalantha TaxID=152367 RepID=A0AAP0ILV9_9MAGN
MDHNQEERAVLMIDDHDDHTSTTTTNSSSPPLITRLTVEEVIEDHVGSFGFSQLLHVFLVSLAWTFDSQNTLVTIFTDAQPTWACKGGGTWCSSGAGPTGPGSICGAKPGSWEWTGGSRGSTVAEWGLVCDRKFLAGLPACLFFIGSLLGSMVYGRVADLYLGRKKTVLISCLSASLTSFLTSLSPNIWVYSFLRFSNGFARSGIGICCLVLSTEVVGRKWRGQVGQYGFFFFTFGFLSLPLIAYPLRGNWRHIYTIISVLPLIYSILVLPFVSESPRWLAVKGRTKEAMEVLNKLARLNGKKIPSNVSISVPNSGVTKGSSSSSGGREYGSLWSASWAARRMLLMMFAGFGVGFVYYGIQLNVENLSFNLYFTVALNALMEIPAVFLGSVLLSFMNRRTLLAWSAYVAGVSCLLCGVFAGKSRSGENQLRGSWAQLSAEAVGFMAASTAFDVMYIYCVELFPTNTRNIAVSLLRQALMLGAAVAPVLVVVGRLSPSFSFLVFGCLAILSGILMYWLPETRNAPLYETLEQQEEAEKLDNSWGSDEADIELAKQ